MTRISFNVSLLGGKFALNLDVLIARNGSDAQDQIAGDAGLDQSLCILDSVGRHRDLARLWLASIYVSKLTYFF